MNKRNLLERNIGKKGIIPLFWILILIVAALLLIVFGIPLLTFFLGISIFSLIGFVLLLILVVALVMGKLPINILTIFLFTTAITLILLPIAFPNLDGLTIVALTVAPP